jgi:hypothetical protein
VEAYELAAAAVSAIELDVESYYVHDGGDKPAYRGPQLVVRVHALKVITIHEVGRQVDEIAPQRANELVGLALDACDEPQPGPGIDTAIGRPITAYQLRVHRALRERRASLAHHVNHYGARALGPRFSAFLSALREATGPLPPTAASAWDLAATWMAPRDLGDLWRARIAIPLPAIVTAFSHDDVVYFRAGQPPQRSELYRLQQNELVWLREGEPAAPVPSDRLRWLLPCGGGVIEAHQEWQQPRRIYVRVDDPARGIYVQRD